LDWLWLSDRDRVFLAEEAKATSDHRMLIYRNSGCLERGQVNWLGEGLMQSSQPWGKGLLSQPEKLAYRQLTTLHNPFPSARL
jgi:hypothetical protein